MNEEIFSMLSSLCGSAFIGGINETADIIKSLLPELDFHPLSGGGIAARLDCGSERTLMLEAHIDQIGFIVTSVGDGGFLKVGAVGGHDLRALPSKTVTIHGKERLSGVFTSLPPHLSSGEREFSDIGDLSVDTGRPDAETLLPLGTLVTFDKPLCRLSGGRVSGCSLDNRAGVAAVISAARSLCGQSLPVNVIFAFPSGEELGLRGAKTAAFSEEFSEAVAVDVSFADYPGVSPEECGVMGRGPMIGVSPTLSRRVSNRLAKLAGGLNIPYQTEIMGGKTSTDADEISVSKSGVTTGLLSIPIRNMHTDCEVADLEDIRYTALLLAEYAAKGGLFND